MSKNSPGHVCVPVKRCPLLDCLSEGLEVAELLEDSLLGDPVLVDETADGDHCKAGVLDLSNAVLLEGGLVLGKAEGIEGEVSGLTLALEGLEKGNNTEDLNEGDPEDDLGATALLNEIVVGINGSHLGEEGKSVGLLDDEAKDRKHGEAAVLELGLAEHAEVEHIGEALSMKLSSAFCFAASWFSMSCMRGGQRHFGALKLTRHSRNMFKTWGEKH